MNMVIYARFSSHSQREESIEGQLKVCYEYAKNNNHVIVGEYIDRAISGTSDNRPQFQKMIADSDKKCFQGILVYQLDRFARNRYDSAVYKAKLKKNGVKVYSARENITNDASGILVEGLLESMAEYYSAELSQKIKRGIELNASKCLFIGGSIPLGYNVDSNKKFIINNETAPIVKEIFEMYAAGKSTIELINYLNNLGIKTSIGRKFNKNSLRKMLQNKKYIGIYTYKNLEIKDGVPKIIDEKLFNKVQKIIEKNKKRASKSKAKEEYILTTKLFCGHCKRMMIGYSGTSKSGKVYNYYVCNGTINKKCNKKYISKRYIEDMIVNLCISQLTDENINKITEKTLKLNKENIDNSRISHLKKLLQKNEEKQSNLINAILESDSVELRKKLYEQSPKLEEENKNIQQEIASEKLKNIWFTESEVKFFLNKLKEGAKEENIDYRKMLIDTFVNSIYLYNGNDNENFKNKLVILFNISAIPVNVATNDLEIIKLTNNKIECSCSFPPYPPPPIILTLG